MRQCTCMERTDPLCNERIPLLIYFCSYVYSFPSFSSLPPPRPAVSPQPSDPASPRVSRRRALAPSGRLALLRAHLYYEF